LSSEHAPADCLSDILDNISRVESYAAGLSKQDLATDGRTRDAIERCLERICEAAFRLGDAAVELMPKQPWHDIRGMGNWFRHGYDRVDLDTVWDTIRNNLPALKADAERALALLRTSKA
jgi:uncharacterized protein with HEPN domain